MSLEYMLSNLKVEIIFLILCI